MHADADSGSARNRQIHFFLGCHHFPVDPDAARLGVAKCVRQQVPDRTADLWHW